MAYHRKRVRRGGGEHTTERRRWPADLRNTQHNAAGEIHRSRQRSSHMAGPRSLPTYVVAPFIIYPVLNRPPAFVPEHMLQENRWFVARPHQRNKMLITGYVIWDGDFYLHLQSDRCSISFSETCSDLPLQRVRLPD